MRVVKITHIVLCVLAAIIVGIFGTFLIYINMSSDQTLAENIRVTDAWTEVDTKTPFIPTRCVQTVVINVEDIDWGESQFDGIYLKDGTVLKPQVEIVDDQGTIHPLRLSGYRQKHVVDAEFSPERGTSGFVKGRKFTKLRIRSDIPFDCKAIYWSDYDPK